MDKPCIGNRLLKAAKEVYECRRQCCAAGRADGSGEAATRLRLLAVARGVFAKKGSSATVRDICHAAKVNVSAVSYHFGSKEGLLAAVLSALLADLLILYPLDGGVPATADAEERLHGFVFAFLCRVLLCNESDEEQVLGQMLSEAFMTPQASFEQYAEAHRKEVALWLSPLLREISSKWGPTGTNIDEEILGMMVRSIIAQILLYNTNRHTLIARRGGRPFTLDEIAAVAKHITLFSLGGIQHISEQSL